MRWIDNNPYVLEHIFLSVSLVPGLNDEILHHSLYDYIQKQLGLRIGSTYRKIAAEKAGVDDIKYLHSQKDDPILTVSEVIYLGNGIPLEVIVNHYPYNSKHAYTIWDNKGK